VKKESGQFHQLKNKEIKMLPYNLVTLGPQGSGKGTQNELLSKKFDMPILIAGDLIRTKAKENDALGKRLRDIINR